MRLTGYSDRWTVRPGESIGFHVHCTHPTFEARLVRLRHGDTNPAGPGFREIEVPSVADGRYPGAARSIRKGSCATLPVEGLAPAGSPLLVSVWVWPTLPGAGAQGIAAWRHGNGEAAAEVTLLLDGDGHVVLRAGTVMLRSAVPLAAREWVQLRVGIDPAAGRLRLTVEPRRWSPARPQAETLDGTLPDGLQQGLSGTLLLAAAALTPTPDGPRPDRVFDGKLARPRILAGTDETAPVLAAWDFATEAGTVRVVDTGPQGRHGRTMNRPARLMTGPFWPGDTDGSGATPETHDAIHFHSDDVADVGWPESLRLVIPEDLPSGVYAIRLRAGEGDAVDEDHLPFFVCPPAGRAGAPLAVLMPTMSYLAYANESLDVADAVALSPRQDMGINPAAYRFVAENGLKSTYDSHRDGSGICLGARRRPIIDFRPRARCRTFDAPHQFAADLHLIDWLIEKGFAFDVLTDDLLHHEGVSVLQPYRAVVTGSHPEYWTTAMLDARDAWLAAGGRLAYLGGNGFYWVTAVAPDDPDVIEIRRYEGTRTWMGEPGEETLASTGERGGLWRSRGRSAHKTVGIGFAGQGFDRGTGYRRSEASFRPEWEWVFRGVPDEIIGAGRSLVLGHGAAGFEVDRTDPRLGTPAHTVILASSLPFTDAYQLTTEDVAAPNPWTGGAAQPERLRADMVFLAHPNGGAVFSTGSITWCATLSAEGYRSDTSRITENVLRGFLADTPPFRG